MKSNDQPRITWLLLLLLPIVFMAAFWLVSKGMAGPGFPLDDAWIHQTYARNFAEHGQWAFQLNQPSAGSTSPLWTALLIPGQLLKIAPPAWVFGLGWLTLVALGLVATRWLGARQPLPSWQLGALGSLFALEWHLVWAGLSGMETLLAGALALTFFWLLLVRKLPPFWLGVIIGLGVWLRPDLLSLAVPAGWVWLFDKDKGANLDLVWPARFFAGIAVLVIPYLATQWALSGSPWPSTFYAKQAEYAALRLTPWLIRFGQQWLAPLAGPLILLLPGVIYWVWQRLARGQWHAVAPAVWIPLYLATFASRLPVTYQHGRYAMPVIPTLLMLGLLGLLEFLSTGKKSRWRWVLERSWLLATLLIALIFSGLGVRAYARDVAIIETEMVAMANWIDHNTEGQALIAAHDIGALGYYGNRTIVDLAGLISPEVIPIIRDEAALADFMDSRSVDYLMTFPDWYQRLIQDLEIVHATEGNYSPAAGGTNMSLYRWR